METVNPYIKRLEELEHGYGVLLASNNRLHERVVELTEAYNLLMASQVQSQSNHKACSA